MSAFQGNEINHGKKNKVSMRSPGCREGEAAPTSDAPGKNVPWLHPLPSISHFLGHVAKNEVQDPSSQSVAIQKGIKENFPEEGLILLASENSLGPHEVACGRVVLCAKTQDPSSPVPLLSPHLAL